MAPRNIADRLRESARRWPERLAVVAPQKPGLSKNARFLWGGGSGQARYREWTFRQLDDESDQLARGLIAMGVRPGMRLVLFVRFSWEFIALTFAIFKTGAVVVLIDPGMGRTNIFECLKEVQPDGFVAIPIVHVARLLKRRLFPRARLNVTVGRRWFWGGETYAGLLRRGGGGAEGGTSGGAETDGGRRGAEGKGGRGDVKEEGSGQQNSGIGIGDWALGIGDSHEATPGVTIANRQSPVKNPPAAVIFTSGSTGAPKGVLYEHSMFDAQVDLIRDFYGIEPGEVDLPGFPLFGLFNAAMGVTTVIPDMDPTKPAQVDPTKIIAAINDWQVTQAFGSPAFWNRVGRYCEEHNITLPTIKRGLSAGGPVPIHVLRRMTRAFTGPGADLHTPYGATESLPVASIGGREVLARTAALTAQGQGTCVGRPFPGVDVRIIAITDGPIASLSEARQLPPGEIGEIIVSGPSVTREYFQRPEATRLAKLPVIETTIDHRPSSIDKFFHRIGDVGYLDSAGLLWFCGRKAHIVETPNGRMFSVCCEAIFDEHPAVYRSALVGVGDKPRQTPVIVVEPEPGQFPETATDADRLRSELLKLGRANPLTVAIEQVLFHRSLPVDTRHNVKINREALAVWGAKNL